MSWVIGPILGNQRTRSARRTSGLDAGDGAISVICDPNRVAADRDGARFGADLDRSAIDLAALQVDPGDRVVLAVGDPDGAGTGVDPARVTVDGDLVDHRSQRGIDLGHGAVAAVGDPDEAAGDGET